MVASSAGTTAQETKNEVQIKGKGQSEVDAIYQKTRSQTNAHPMGTAEQSPKPSYGNYCLCLRTALHSGTPHKDTATKLTL